MQRIRVSLIAVIACVSTSMLCGNGVDADSRAQLRGASEIAPSPVEEPLQTRIGVYSVQATSNWNLDITDGVLDGAYNYPDGATGTGVDIYVVDTGIYVDHPEFGGRAIRGKNFASSDPCDYQSVTYRQWDGHGTHVAGTIGSQSYGIAKNVRIIDVRVLDNCGYGDTDIAARALRWVIRHHKASRVAVVNLSLGAQADSSTLILENATRALLADNVIPVVAAGNESSDACGSSPANVNQALTVGAVRSSGSDIYMAGYSNYGSCIDLLAPGSNILSTWNNYRPAGWTAYSDGTSMATPLVSGIAALVAQRYPNKCAASVRDAVVAAASPSFGIRNLIGSTPDLLAQLNLAVVPASSAPGNVTQVIPVATAGRTITVGWDRPCSGGSALIDYTMNVYRNGMLVDTATLPGNLNSIVVHGTVNGYSYSFDVTARNSLGSSAVVSPRSREVVSGQLRVGSANARLITDVVGVQNASQVTVAPGSGAVCAKVNTGTWNLVGLASGTCNIYVRPFGGGYTYLRSITVT